MYIADLFNKNNLFQNFGGWFRDTKASFFSQFTRSKDSDLKTAWQSWKNETQIFETFLGFATSVIININQIKLLEKKCILQFKILESQLNLLENRIIFWSYKLVNLLSKISPVINSIRIMENLLLELISKNIGHFLPQNMDILIKNGSKSYQFLPIDLWDKIEQYWNKTGKLLSNYSNLDLYLFSLTVHSYLEISPKKRILVLLPDNPEIDNSQKFVYNNNLDAISFLRNSFEDFHRLVEDISLYFGYEPTYILQGWSFIEYQNLPGKRGTVALIIKDPEKNKGIEIIREGGKPIFNKVSPS